MSFSSDVKNELCRIKPNDCCSYAQLYGMLLFCKNFSNNDIFFSADRKEISNRLLSIIKQIYGFSPKIILKSGRFALTSDIINVATVYTDIIEKEYITDAFYCDDCLANFTRGAFLVSGTITDPEKSFHAEIKTSREEVAISLQSVLINSGLNARLSKRREQYVVYFKGSEKVSDFLTFIGAYKKSLEVIEASMVNELRNKVNRAKNCETGNIGKTVNAAVKQKEAIIVLQKCGKYSSLSDELKSAAELRLNNPDMSLNELSSLSGISKSGLNHRLNRLIELAKEYKS